MMNGLYWVFWSAVTVSLQVMPVGRTTLWATHISDSVVGGRARGRFAVANIDTVDALHIIHQYRLMATIWE